MKKTRNIGPKVKGLKWLGIVAAVAVPIIGLAVINANSGSDSEARMLNDVAIEHAHGMSYSSDGSKIFFAVHDGLRVYENGQWVLPAGEKHDYMGFSMVDDGFYSSGHPASGSNKKNPFGIVKSMDEGKSFEPLALYGEVDFHGMTAGFKSHTIYVFNSAPNTEMSRVGLYYSTDEADNWALSDIAGLEGQPMAIAAHPSDAAFVAVGTDNGLFVSRDYGNTFERVDDVDMQVSALAFHANGVLYAAGFNDQPAIIRVEIDAKQTKTINLPDMMANDIAFVASNPAAEQELTIMTVENDIFTSADLGGSWLKIVDKGKGKSK